MQIKGFAYTNKHGKSTSNLRISEIKLDLLPIAIDSDIFPSTDDPSHPTAPLLRATPSVVNLIDHHDAQQTNKDHHDNVEVGRRGKVAVDQLKRQRQSFSRPAHLLLQDILDVVNLVLGQVSHVFYGLVDLDSGLEGLVRPCGRIECEISDVHATREEAAERPLLAVVRDVERGVHDLVVLVVFLQQT